MLTHYIIVRRDLPLGVLAAMVTHAAGESAHLYEDPYDGRFRGATAVVLEAKNEAHLKDYIDYVKGQGLLYTVVTESGGPYHGQDMAIGVCPGDRNLIGPIFADAQCLKELVPSTCSCTTCVDNQKAGG